MGGLTPIQVMVIILTTTDVGGELIIEAPLEVLREAARVLFGALLKEEKEDRKIVFTYDAPVCQPKIIVEEIGKGKYRVTCRSLCSIGNCPYWDRCVRIDNERLKSYEIALKKILGEEIIKKAEYKWIPERVKEEEVEKLIDKIISRRRE